MITETRKKLSSSGIGGSEIAAVVGLSPHTTAHEVWARRCAPGLYPEIESHHLERGRFGEPMLRDWLAHRLGRKITGEQTFASSNPICFATPDGLVLDDSDKPDAICELKFPNWRTARQWDQDGDIEIPPHYVCQVQWELTATRATHKRIDRAVFAAFVDGDLRYTYFLHDDELEKMLLDRAHNFWDRYVVPKTPPPPDASKPDKSEDFLRLFYKSNSAAKMLTPPDPAKALDLLAAAHAARAERDAADDKFTLAKNELLSLIGEYDGIEVAGFKATWRQNKSSAKTDYSAIADELLGKMAESDRAEIIERHTAIVPGPRVFRLTKKD